LLNNINKSTNKLTVTVQYGTRWLRYYVTLVDMLCLMMTDLLRWLRYYVTLVDMLCLVMTDLLRWLRYYVTLVDMLCLLMTDLLLTRWTVTVH